MGYSLGSLNALYISHLMPELVDGLILFSPYVDVHKKLKKYTVLNRAVHTLAPIIPSYFVVSGIDRNPTYNEYFHRDPLKTQSVTVNLLSNIMKLQEGLPDPQRMRIPPTLSVTGGQDRTVNCEKALQYLSST